MFQLVYVRGVVKNRLDGKHYLIIYRQAFLYTNLDEVLLEEDQIKLFYVKVYSCTRIFGGKQLIDARY